MLDRFYAPTSFDTPVIELPEKESHHLAHVLRKGIGDQVYLFDGQGRSATANVESMGRRSVRVRIIEHHAADPPTRTELVLAVPLPRGDRSRWLVEKATELGVSALVPLHTARSVVDPRAARLDKLRQTVMSACKQCGRNRLMEICEPRAWPDLLAEVKPGTRLLVADRARAPVLEALSRRQDERLFVAVGPEGGFTTEELALAAGLGAEAVSLGPHVLRIETAAVALSALVLAAAHSS
jgi:16S rRNA (uracil1498-N3)-methyltransferase